MALNLKNSAVEQLVEEICALTGETKTGAVLRALEERRSRLAAAHASGDRKTRLLRFLERDVWPTLPECATMPLTRDQEDALLGYGPEGV